LRKAEIEKGLHTFFKLQTTISTTSMVLFDHLGVLRKFEKVEEIMQEFFDLRLDYYGKRKRYMEGILGAEAAKLSNQARFILEKCSNQLVIENKKKKAMIDELQRKGYDSDPIKAWKKAQQEENDEEEEDDDSDPSESSTDAGGPDYDYLLGMKMWSLTQEKKDELLKNRDQKQQELKDLQATTKEQLYIKDLDEFEAKLAEVEIKEKEDEAGSSTTSKGGKNKKAAGGGKKGQTKHEIMPSPHGLRVMPRIGDDLKIKTAKAAAAKSRKANKEEKKMKDTLKEKDEFDAMVDDKDMNKSLTERLGLSGEKQKKMKQTTLKFEKKSPKKKSTKNPWSDDEEDEDIGSGSDLSDAIDEPVVPREKTGSRRAAATTKKYNIMDSDEGQSSESDGEFYENDGVKEESQKPAAASAPSKTAPTHQESSDDDFAPSKPSNGVNGHKRKKTDDSDDDPFVVSDSDDEGGLAAKVAKKTSKPTAAPAPKKKLLSSDALFDSMMADGDDDKPPAAGDKKPAAAAKKTAAATKKPAAAAAAAKPKAAPKPKKAAAPKPKKRPFDSDSDDSPKAKSKSKKTAKGSDSDESGSDMEFNSSDIGPARDRPGRARKPVTYAAAGNSSDDSDY